jgi:hypothetical protein
MAGMKPSRLDVEIWTVFGAGVLTGAGISGPVVCAALGGLVLCLVILYHALRYWLV